LFVLEARVAAPGAFERIADFHAQTPEALDLELDPVRRPESAQAPVVGAGGEHVARIERVDSADPLDAAGNPVRHVARVEILLEHAVTHRRICRLMRVADLIGGDEAGPMGAKVSRDFIW